MEKTSFVNRKLFLSLILSAAMFIGTGFFSGLNNKFSASISSVEAAVPTTPTPIPSVSWTSTSLANYNVNVDVWFADQVGRDGTTPATAYQISDAFDLAYLAYKTRVASSNYLTFDGVYFEQTANIDLSGNKWVPIGTSTSTRRFKGIYDGGDYTISNMFAQIDSGTYYGLFGYTELATLKNINIVDGYVNNDSSSYTGLLVGYALNTIIDNVNVAGLATGDNNTTFIAQSSYIGGVAGLLEFNDATLIDAHQNNFSNVTTDVVVNGLQYVGGSIGLARNVNITNVHNLATSVVTGYNTSINYVGGVVGATDGIGSVVYDNLINDGVVTGLGSTIGGLVGNSTNVNVTLIIQNSSNNAVITGLQSTTYKDYVGGIIGRVYYITLDNVTNTAEIIGRSQIGGLIGRSERETIIYDSSNQGTITANGNNVGGLAGVIADVTIIDNSYNDATITSSLTTGYVGTGGLVGNWGGKNSVITNSYNDGEITGSGVGGAIGYISGADIEIDGFTNNGDLYSSRYYSGSNQRGVGGVIGLAGNAGSIITVDNSENNGYLYGSYVGGAIGNALAMSLIDINDFTNNVDILLTETTIGQIEGTSDTTSALTNALGGIVGYSNARISINSALNYGEIAGSGNYTGGLVGRLLNSISAITDSYAYEDVTGYHYVGGLVGEGRGEITNTIIQGNVTGTGNYVGGLVGSYYGGTITNSTNIATAVITGGTLVSEVATDGSYVGGLIGITNSGSTVVIVNSPNNAIVVGKNYVGGLIGRSGQTTTITNSDNLNNVYGYFYQIGGLVGNQSAGSLIINSSDNTGDIYGSMYYLTYVGNTSYSTGGLVGATTSSNSILKIYDSNNSGYIEGQFAAGIVGFHNISVSSNAILNNVVNNGNVTSIESGYYNNNTADTRVYGGYAAGIVGATATNAGAMAATNVVNNGVITGRYVGGIASAVYSMDIYTSVNNGTLNATFSIDNQSVGVGGIAYQSYYFIRIYSSYNTADITLPDLTWAAGGLVGYARHLVIRNSYNEGDITNTFDYSQTFLVYPTTVNNYDNYFGGLVAYSNNATTLEISGSYNTGNLDVYGRYVGGLIGRANNTYGATVSVNGITVIENSYVQANLTNQIGASLNVDSYVGGAIGDNAYGLNIHNVAIMGDFVASDFVGGLVGRTYINFNVLDGLDYEITNSYYIGNMTVAPRNNNNTYPAVGGFIGWVYFSGSASQGLDKDFILTISNSYNRTQITTTATRVGGFVGYIQYSGVDVRQSVVGENSFFTEDTANGYADLDFYQSLYYYLLDTRDYDFTTSGTVDLTTIINPTTYDAWNLGGDGTENTYWAISSTFNSGMPYLSNMFAATFTVNGNGGTINTLAQVVYSEKVGNLVTLTETLIKRPVRQYYEFVSFNTLSDGLGTSYEYGDLIEINNQAVTLYAIWEPERILISIVSNGILLDSLDNPVSNYYITADTDYKIDAQYGAGDSFIRWEIYNPATSVYELLSTNETILLDTIIDNTFINTYSFLDNNGRKTISFQPIITGTTESFTINFGAGSTDLGTVLVDSNTYRMGTMVTVTADTNHIITVTPKAHYEFAGFTLRDINGVLLDASLGNGYLVAQNGNEYTFAISERIVFEINFTATEYTITVTPVLYNSDLSAAQEIVGTTLLSGDEDQTITIGQTHAGLATVAADEYGFVNYFVYNNALSAYTVYTPTVYTANFLNTFANGSDEINILAAFVRKYLFTVAPDVNNAGNGDIMAYIRNADMTTSSIESGDYIEEGQNIIIQAYPNSNSTFAGFTGLDASEYAGTIANFRITEDTDVTVLFNLSYFSLIAQTIDNNNQSLATSNVGIVSNAANLNAVTVGTQVYKVGLLETQVEGYLFTGWYINVNGVLTPVSELDEFTIDGEGNIGSFFITQDFVNNYANDESEIIIVAQYYKLYFITVESSDSSMGTYELYTIDLFGEEVLVDPSTTQLPYGTELLIRPVNSNEIYYTFVNYTGTEDLDVFEQDDLSLRFTLTADRFITLNYIANELTYVASTDIADAKGDITFSTDKFAVNEKVTITFNVASGYEVRDWTIYDKDGVAYSASELTSNITYRNNTIVLTVDEYWLENFGLEFDSKVVTMMNSTYFMTILIGGIATPLLLAGIIVFVILNNKKKAEAKAALDRSRKTEFGLNQQQFIQNLRNGNVGNKDDSNKGKQ